LNSICVGALDADGSTTDHTDDTIPCWSNWENPKVQGSSSRKEAERPDIVMEGADALVMDVSGTTNWIEADGTSFAAPVIAGIIALNEGICGYDEEKPSQPVNYRTLFRTAAYTRTSAATGSADIYPIPGYSADAHAGAGLPLAGAFYASCGMDAPNPGENDPVGEMPDAGEIDPNDDGWFNAPTGILSLSEENIDTVTYGEWPNTIGGLKHGTNTQLFERGIYGAAAAGTRIRATFSYYTCPSAGRNATSTHDDGPNIDFDFILCDLSASPPKCPGISQSNDDTSEGFDIILPTSFSDLRFYVVKDGTASYPGCENYHFEPYMIWPLSWPP
jgi:hypothetical protein